MNALHESLSKCRIEGNTLFLPSENLPNYADVRKALLNAGAKYYRNTFVFPSPAQSYIERLMGGEKVNIKKEFQFFETPPELADRLVALAMIKQRHSILEPSAGNGRIIEALRKNNRYAGYIYFCEINPICIENLKKLRHLNFLGDFLKLTVQIGYDRIIANPPFSKNQDIDHIYKMYEVCAPGGRIITIASKHWQTSTNKKEAGFDGFIKALNAEIIDLPKGTFHESGTETPACIIIINKKN